MSSEIVYGFHPVRELLRGRPQAALKVLLSDRRQGRRRQEIEDLCERHRVDVAMVSEVELRGLTGTGTHNGFAAEVRRAADLVAGGDPNLRMLVEDIQDPRNLGALIRVCEGSGVGKVLIRDRGAAPVSPVVVKASAGASEWLPIERVPNSSQLIRGLKDEGFWVYGADASGQPPWELDLTGKVLLCLGGEEKGLRAQTKKLCDALVGLPMRGRLASLNVATAASAVLYEAVRQRL